MPTGFVQTQTDNTPGSPATQVLPGASTVHNFMFICFRIGPADAGTISVSDDVNGAWTRVSGAGFPAAAVGGVVDAWYFQNTAAGTPTVTISWTLSTTASFRSFYGEVATSVTTGVVETANGA